MMTSPTSPSASQPTTRMLVLLRIAVPAFVPAGHDYFAWQAVPLRDKLINPRASLKENPK
jgi:hypothetical protein